MGMVAVVGADTQQRVIALAPFWLLAVAVLLAVTLAVAAKVSPSRLRPLLLTLVLWLPFVPGSIPAWLLVFEGPIEIGVWTLVAFWLVGQARLRTTGISKAPSEHPGLAPITAALIAALAYGAAAYALRDHLPIGDEPHYLMITQSLIKDGDLQIENNHTNRDYAPFMKFDIPPHYLTRGTDGQIYSVHNPGVSVLVLPMFAIFGYYGGVATVMACVAVASAIAWHAAWLLTAQVAAAWIAWAALFLSAPVFLQAVTVFPDAVGVLPVVAGVWMLIALDGRKPLSDRTVLIVGALLAWLPWLHTRFALLAGGLGVAIALRLLAAGWRRVALFLAIPAVSAVLWFAFFWWIWGSPSPTAPWGTGITSRIEWIPRGVWGLLFDPQAGLLLPAPGYAFAFIGWLVMLRRKPRLAIELALILIPLTASVAAYETWWGGQGAPARYLVAALPLLLPPIAWMASRSAALGRLTATAVVTGILLLSAKVVVAGGAYTFNPETGSNPIFTWMSPSASVTSGAPTPTASMLSFVSRWQPGILHRMDTTDVRIGVDEPIEPAFHAARLGEVRVFFMDQRAYPEPTGFWTQAEAETTVIMDRDDPSGNLGVRLQAGPVSTTAEVLIDGAWQQLSFAPRQRHEIVIPPASAGAWKVTIRPGAGFRPIDVDPAANDLRRLGLWVEVF